MRDPTVAARGRTRWRRFGLLFAPAMGLVTVVMLLMMMGVLALPIAISGVQFKVNVDQIVPHAGTATFGSKDFLNNPTTFSAGFVQYGDADFINGAQQPVLVTVLPGGADLGNLQQCVPLPPLKLTITADDADATGGLVVDMLGMSTASDQTATFTNLKMGIPILSTRSGQYEFGQSADSLSIPKGSGSNTVQQTAVYVSAGTFQLKHLGLSLGTGTC